MHRRSAIASVSISAKITEASTASAAPCVAPLSWELINKEMSEASL
jgi:hypothetical protein